MHQTDEYICEESDQDSEGVIDSQSEHVELNPFMFELNYGQKKWELIEAYVSQALHQPFKPQIQKKIIKIKRELQSLVNFISRAENDHSKYESLRCSYEGLKYKTVNYDQLLQSIEKGYTRQIDEVKEELVRNENAYKQFKKEYEQQIDQLQQKLEQQFEQKKNVELEIGRLLEKQATIQESLHTAEKQLLLSQKEAQQLKVLKTGGQLASPIKKDQPFSTFELVISSKVKSGILRFLEIDEIQKLLMTSKRLYLALSPLKFIIPQIVFCKTKYLEKSIKVLNHQKTQLENLQNQCSYQMIVNQMVKCFYLQQNPTEMMSGILLETQQLISGSALGINSDQKYQGESSQGLTIFIQQIATRASQCIKELKQNPFNIQQFSQQLIKAEQDIRQVSQDKNVVFKQLKMKSQEVQEQLFNLGSIAASEPGLYGSYLAQLQKSCAQLFTFSTSLVTETKQLIGLIYYLAIQYWNILEKDKITEDLMERQKIDLEQALNHKANLQYFNFIYMFLDREKVKLSEKQSLQKDEQRQELVIQLETEIRLRNQLEQELTQLKNMITNHSSNVKILALGLKEQKRKNQDLVEQHDQTLQKFNLIKEDIRQLLEKV